MKALGSLLADLVWPPRCLGCGCGLEDSLRDLCGDCADQLEWIERPFCQRCGLPAEAGVEAERSWLCRDCGRQPRAFVFARSALVLDGLQRELLHRWKLERQEVLRPMLRRLMARLEDERLRPWVEQKSWVVPVPMDPWRRLWRGFDPCAELAAGWARPRRLPVVRALRRGQRRGRQLRRNRQQRQLGWDGVFVVPRRLREALAQRPVILVDDVLTTGATVDAAARALRDAGCPDVAVITLVRER